MREEIDHKIEKMQEAPPSKTIKALPAPDDAPKKRRGGRRYRLHFYVNYFSIFSSKCLWIFIYLFIFTSNLFYFFPSPLQTNHRARQQKEAYAVTELRQAQNRMSFGVAEDETVGSFGSTKGLGLIGQQTGKIRASAVDSRTKGLFLLYFFFVIRDCAQ